MMFAITGASGKIGTFLIKELDAQNIEYVPISRRKHNLKNEVVSDFGYSLKDILSSVDCLIHLAGSTNTENSEELIKSNVELTKKILDNMPTRLHLVHASSISVYGKMLKSMPATEETPVNPDSDYAKSKYEAERLVLENHKHSTILRLGTVYGPFNDYFEMLNQINKGKAYIIGNGNNHIPFTFVNDVARLFVTAAKKKIDDLFLAVGDEPTQKEIYELASKYLEVDLQYTFVPYTLARLFLKLKKFGKNKTYLTQEHLDVLYYDRIFESSKAKKLLGFDPVPFELGIKQVIDTFLNKQKD